VFFTASLGLMGMYVGNGAFIHAPHTGDVVKISSLNDPWYSSEYMGAVRVTG
jgi:cell wall-associated NlpC family hydrolase